MTGWAHRYRASLGREDGPPTQAGLRAITAAHVQRVPFENITSILRRRDAGDRPGPPLDLDEMLDAWTERRGGGVCFEVVAMVERLLSELGYRAHAVLGQISFPGSHMA